MVDRKRFAMVSITEGTILAVFKTAGSIKLTSFEVTKFLKFWPFVMNRINKKNLDSIKERVLL